MSFSLHKKAGYVLGFIISVLFFNNVLIASTNKINNFKIVTMQPISDEVDDDIEFNNTSDNSQLTRQNVVLNGDYSDTELKCLTQTIYYEAKSESYDGGIAVGNVIMNRVKSGKFPSTICGVMKQKTGKMCQFSFMCNGQIHNPVNKQQWRRSEKIALEILNGTAPSLSNGALFFHAKYAKLRLASNRYTAKIGQHYFYK